MRSPIVMPDLGPAILSLWLVNVQENVFAGDRLVEVLLGDATFDVPAPVSGRLVQKLAFPDEPLSAGQVLGYLESTEE